LRLVVRDESLDPAQFNGRETKITRQADWRQPELRRLIVSVDMDMRRFVQVVAHENTLYGPLLRTVGMPFPLTCHALEIDYTSERSLCHESALSSLRHHSVEESWMKTARLRDGEGAMAHPIENRRSATTSGKQAESVNLELV